MQKKIHKTLQCLFLLLAAWAGIAAADYPPEITSRVFSFFPQATDIGPVRGDPPSAPVFRNEKVIGYIFFADDVVRIPAYSGKPIRTLVGFDITGKVAGISIVSHEEPILVVGISDEDLDNFINQYKGTYVTDKIKIGGRDRDNYVTIDGISGATITVMVLNASVTRSLRKVAISRGLFNVEVKGETKVVTYEETELEPVWVTVWKERIFQIVILCIGLFVLMLILILQDWLARHPSLLIYVRYSFLVYTVVFIGWYTLAQLSIVNVFTFMNAFLHDFSWDNFMVDPMIFILWGFVGMTVLFWGRGVYCGWLCPFGALQELVFRLGEFLKIRTFEFPEVVHERLWAIKYIILMALFGVSLQSMVQAEVLAEVEPFKTAFTLRFQREWSYVLYATGLIVISVFNRKFYCRYMCPLGAALTFPSKFKIFSWLRRYKECGRPCQICRGECEVRAIRSTGEINENECHYCLDCQVTYYNAYKCPPLVEKRKKREKSQRLRPQNELPVTSGTDIEKS